ncbi:MAG: indole-3-glycerol phosphate synthase [Bacteroidetes bacterium GWE2_29_8]|nr:MAG: indole-3-glycerol phosphate synthase [Bacteroidetes bacterium GWE2_29_8]OFY17980.1 MAG: indole-3-glycerol phosphate synthase [Bacteroidetes bacterium GWF2_29_10]
MDILTEIIDYKRKYVEEKKSLYPVKLLEKSFSFFAPTVSLKKYIKRTDLHGIIAEIKRKSPSKGFINKYADLESISIGYMQAGASAISVLTDEKYFGGSNEDLKLVRKFNFCPILRKDFIVDEYQIIEAKSIGADAILLIAAALKEDDVKKLAKFAKSLSLEVLLEVNNKEEIEKYPNEFIDIVGINNRNLKSFEVDLNRTINLINHIPKNFIKISESGIKTPEEAYKLKQNGADGFLIGGLFMSASQPEKECASFINKLKQMQEIANL